MISEPHISRTIAWLQFPMAALVHFNHIPSLDSPLGPVRFVEQLIYVGLAKPVMPAFFFIAGYLFFYGCDNFKPGVYLRKLSKRCRTLLLPYAIWSLIFCLCMCAYGMMAFPTDTESLFDTFVVGSYSKLSVTPFGNSFRSLPYPDAAQHLWFIRDLMLLMILSPAVWLLGRLDPRLSIPLISLAALLNAGIPGVGSDAPVWFTLGSLFAIHRIDMVRLSHRLGWKIVIPWLILTFLYTGAVHFFDYHHYTYGPKSILAGTLSAFTGVFAYFAIASRSLYPGDDTLSADRLANSQTDYRTNRFNTLMLMLLPTCFFFYAIHPLPLIDRYIRITDYFVTDPDWKESAAFFSVAILKLILIPLLFFALRRVMPRTLSLLTGGRSART